MDPVILRLRALDRDLRASLAALKTMEAEVKPAIHQAPFVFARAREPLEREVENTEALFEDLGEQRVTREQAWKRLRSRDAAAQRAIRPARELVNATLARVRGAEGEGCRLADFFLERLAYSLKFTWEGFTLLDYGESFEDEPEIVRLKAPSPDLWSLPIAAHEFGHFMLSRRSEWLPQSRLRTLFLEYIGKDGRPSDSEKAYAAEHMADCFAAWVLGPAYLCACVLLRFDPTVAASAAHPADGDRVTVLQEMLVLMKAWPRFMEVMPNVADAWSEMEKINGVPPADPEHQKNLKKIALRMSGMLKRTAPEVEYTDWAAAVSTYDELVRGAPVTTRDLGHLLNGSWRARLDGKPEEEIGERARSTALEWMTAAQQQNVSTLAAGMRDTV